MTAPRLVPDSEMAAQYLRENFGASDRLAIVLLNRRTQRVIQRLGTSEEIAGPAIQRWLCDHNVTSSEVYISMNSLNADARGRTKKDVAAIRHLYLDFDEDGTGAVATLLARQDLPRPNYLISTSPGKWQVSWKVQGFAKQDAENLQRGLARQTGADPAATDIARVLRLPGFYNHKYARPYLVRAEAMGSDIYLPEQFRIPGAEHQHAPDWKHRATVRPRKRPGPLSQSEHDWAFAKRALARGESPANVVAAIATYRRYDKHNLQYYAELTVWKAAQALHAERAQGLERI